MNYYQGELIKGYPGTRCYLATYKLKVFWDTMFFFFFKVSYLGVVANICRVRHFRD